MEVCFSFQVWFQDFSVPEFKNVLKIRKKVFLKCDFWSSLLFPFRSSQTPDLKYDLKFQVRFLHLKFLKLLPVFKYDLRLSSLYALVQVK